MTYPSICSEMFLFAQILNFHHQQLPQRDYRSLSDYKGEGNPLGKAKIIIIIYKFSFICLLTIVFFWKLRFGKSCFARIGHSSHSLFRKRNARSERKGNPVPSSSSSSKDNNKAISDDILHFKSWYCACAKAKNNIRSKK